jgi:aspartate/methionine/tyrosine aminotransferase
MRLPGAKAFRDAIAKKTKWYLGLEIRSEAEITVTCGSTEGMISAMMATVDPGDEVIVFEPFYENYAPDAILSDATPRYVPLRAPDWSFDRNELRAAFNARPGSIIYNPNNPTGKVFMRDGWNSSPGLSGVLTRSASPMKSTNTSCIRAKREKSRIFRWRRSKACVNAR